MKKYIIAVTVVVIALLYMKLNREDGFDPEILIKGKNVLVTGASGGIGEQIAYQYARMGANVFITARREGRLKEVLANCKKLGLPQASFGYMAADMAEYRTVAKQLTQNAVTLFGGLDHVVLNHADIGALRVWEGSAENLRRYEKRLAINTISYVYLAAEALPYLKKSDSEGCLGVISSMSGKLPSLFLAEYSSSKFALDGFFSTVRAEITYKRENVSITVCNLGFIGTNIGNESKRQLGKYLRSDLNSTIWSLLMPSASVSETALEVIKSTALRHRELYYPPSLGSRYLLQSLPAIRHLFPTLLDTGIYSD